MLNRQGRATQPAAVPVTGPGADATFAGDAGSILGHRGLDHEERLIFEMGEEGRSGVDLPEPPKVESRLGGLARQGRIGLPGLAEPQVVRHFVRLSRRNYAIDLGLYPLGSCTMKHNPRLNEKMARLPGLGDVHPLQPQSTVQGALELIERLAGWIMTLTGMPAVAMSPAAGAHGELCGLMAIHAAHVAKGDARKRVLVPESAHGTNPATAALCGYTVDPIPATADGNSASLTAVRYISVASRSAIHAATVGVGTGRMSSDATLVSMTSIRAAQEKSGGSRIGPRGGSSSSTPPRDAKHSRVNVARFRGPA